MEMASVGVIHHAGRNGLQRQRQEALAKALRQEFYQSDRVKQFHRALLFTEALKERDEQLNMKRSMTCTANEEAKNLLVEVRQRELQAVDQERKKELQRHLERKAVGEYVKQQMKEQELRKQRREEKEKEVEECKQLREQYEREKAILKQKEIEKKKNAMKAHLEHVSITNAVRALEAQKQEMEEERKRLFDMEKEKLKMKIKEKETERRRVVQRYKEMVAERLATEMQKKTKKEEKLTAKILADTIANWEAKLAQDRKERAEKRRAMLNAIAAQREYKRREQEQKEREERQNERTMLNARIEQDRIFWETERLMAQKQEKERSIMDDILRRQITDRRAHDRRRKQEQLDFDNKYSDLIAEEEQQFQQYAAGIIRAAKKANRNTFPLLRAAERDMWSGVGPISGGMRASYLLPGASYSKIPNYVGSTTKDIKQLYDTRNKHPGRLYFIW